MVYNGLNFFICLGFEKKNFFLDRVEILFYHFIEIKFVFSKGYLLFVVYDQANEI